MCNECDCNDPTTIDGLADECPCNCHAERTALFESATWRLIQWHIDPGHGWLRVPLELLEDKGLRESISPYSYMDHEFAYLEEDCDAARFADFYGITTHRFGTVHRTARGKVMYSPELARRRIGPRAH